MRIINLSNDNYLLFLNKDLYDIKSNDKKEIAKYFKELLQKLKRKYHIDLHGYYELEIYSDFNYGMIVELNKISDDYFDLFNKRVEIRIIYHKDKRFLYKIDDLDFLEHLNADTYRLYQLNDEFYVEFKNKLKDKIKYQVFEFSTMFYGNNKKTILKNAIELCSNALK